MAMLFRAWRSCAALLAATGLAPAQLSTDASIGTWPFLVGNMDPQIGALVTQTRGRNLDTIYVNVFRTTGPRAGTLWIDDAAGTWNPAWGPVRPNRVGIDLRALIAQAHAQNLQVVGVVKCFDAGVQPTDAAHRAYLLSICDYLVNSFDPTGAPHYDLDGLSLDYVRFVGTSCTNDPQVVTDFVRDVKQRLGGRSLHAYLIANRFTFDGPTYNGVFNSYAQVRSTLRSCYGQDWEELSRWVDVLMPMAYTADGSIYSTYTLHQAYVRQTALYCQQAVQRAGTGPRRVVPAIRCWTDANETATPQTIAASITGAMGGGASGYNAFRYGTMQAAWWPVLAQYAAPGPDLPVPGVAVGIDGLTAVCDASGSRSAKQTAASLTVRYDLDNDGVFETPWGSSGPRNVLARGPGSLRIGVQVRDAQGHVGATARSAVAGPVLGAPVLVSAAAGGPVSITFDVGPGGAGHSYLVTGSLSGSSPGTPIGGLVLPINYDSVTAALLASVNTPVLVNGFATLDANGRGSAVFSVPAGVLAPLVPRALTWAVLGADPSGTPAFVTNPTATVITP